MTEKHAPATSREEVGTRLQSAMGEGDRAGWWLAAMIFLACSGLYYLTRSPSLDEWDSIQFAMGVREFNLWKHQPHPPGYPLYVAFGWLGERWLGLNVHDALALGSALGGGMFVAGWFMLIVRRFPMPLTVMSTVALAGSVNTWMNATKVLTDPLGTGLLTLALVWFDVGERRAKVHQRLGFLCGGSLTAAAAAGVRPQNAGILLLIVVLATVRESKHRDSVRQKCWWMGPGAFAAGCLAWVAPVMAIQARVPESGGQWWAYGSQLIAQWRWRLDQPRAFLGATGQGGGMLLYRLDHHVLGWFTRGFGFSLATIQGWVGLIVTLNGWLLYFMAVRRGANQAAGTPAEPGAALAAQKNFWRTHLPWASTYLVMIFCCLPGDQRYYLPVFPLFILAAVAGWWTFLRGRWRCMAVAVPVMIVLAAAPLVRPNHFDEPPPVRMLRWLQTRYPTVEQPDVWLVLRDSRRHAEWYAPGFHLIPAERFDPLNPPEGLAQAREIYTDDASLVRAWPSAKWRLAVKFQRSPVIYRKHSETALYHLEAAEKTMD